MNKIGYDTVRGYWSTGDQYWAIVQGLISRGMCPDGSRPSRDNNKYYYTMKVGKGVLKIDCFKNIQIVIQCSLPRILYGNNYYLADPTEAARAIKIISKSTGLNFGAFDLCRIDTTAMLDLSFDYNSLRSVVRAPKHHKYLYDLPKGICFATGKENCRKRDRALAFYNKLRPASEGEKGVIRIEARLKTPAKIKSQIKHDCKIGELVKDSFSLACISYLQKVTGEATSLHRRSDFTKTMMAALADTISSPEIDTVK